jgi:hypothetical protein
MALNEDNISSIRHTKNQNINDITNAATVGESLNNSTSNNVNYSNSNVAKVNSTSNLVTDLNQNVTTAVSDPFGSAINLAINKINKLVPIIESKIDTLEQDIIKKSDSKGRVTIQGNTIVITVTKEDQSQAIALESKISTSVNSIKNTIVNLKNLLTVFSSINTAISIFTTIISFQESAIMLNPVTGPTYNILKKGIKIIFLKEMVSAYSVFLKSQIEANQKILDNLINKFSNLNITIKISDQANIGSYINESQAQSLLADDLLNTGTGQQNIKNITSDYNNYVLKVEKYGSKEIIGRAYDRNTGLIAAETAPSLVSTPDQLINELKTILNIRS